MEVFVAGGFGAMGQRLIPLLVASGQHVIATSRMPSKLDGLRAQGADPVIVDGLDKDAVMQAIESSQPDVIVHQTTAIASRLDLKRFDSAFALT